MILFSFEILKNELKIKLGLGVVLKVFSSTGEIVIDQTCIVCVKRGTLAEFDELSSDDQGSLKKCY